jgi:glucose-1-phosphate cytidylyltransferase
MKLVLLCGGFGTRIRDVSDNLPKPMIPIGNYPILWHIMKYYSHWGHRDFVLCLGYKSDVIKHFFLNYEAFTRDFTVRLGRATQHTVQYHTSHDEADWAVTLAETGANAMTGARLSRVKKYLIDEEDFFLNYGDGVGNVDLEKLVAFHKSHGKALTVTGVRPPGRFGELVADVRGQVTEFNEKPQAVAGLISGGFFVCNRRIFSYLDQTEGLVFEKGPMKRLAAEGEMMVYPHDGFWQPMDTHREYLLLNELYANRQAPWVVW